MVENRLYELSGETLIINLPEELDHHVAQKLRQQTDYLFISKRIRNVIFNYEKTSFMDSSGIGLVMGRYREVRYLKGNIYLVNINPKMKRVIEISGLYKVAKRTDDVHSALEEIVEMAKV
ncbi:MAG: STAS domain-containing protein [Lachnospiraceae bacterium]|nr:STAS domain-containing protein [Lachnospiraceae bacterium]